MVGHSTLGPSHQVSSSDRSGKLAVTDPEGERFDQSRAQQDFTGLYSSLQDHGGDLVAQGPLPPGAIDRKEAAVFTFQWILARMIREGADPCDPETNEPVPTFLDDPEKSARTMWNSIRHLDDPDHNAHSSATEAFQQLDGFIKFTVLDTDSEDAQEQLKRVRTYLSRLNDLRAELTS